MIGDSGRWIRSGSSGPRSRSVPFPQTGQRRSVVSDIRRTLPWGLLARTRRERVTKPGLRLDRVDGRGLQFATETAGTFGFWRFPFVAADSAAGELAVEDGERERAQLQQPVVEAREREPVALPALRLGPGPLDLP